MARHRDRQNRLLTRNFNGREPLELQTFIEGQHVFFVATAPSGPEGHINVSPKGLDSFRVLTPTSVAYLDLTGSGNETAAHVAQNGRITFMFCAFQGKPLILRLYGKARGVLPADPKWSDLVRRFPSMPGMRQIIVAEITRIQTACGSGVPLMTFEVERSELLKWAEATGEVGLQDYRTKNNRTSIDGLAAPGR